jgi:predicted site-specific integrase-resolvase
MLISISQAAAIIDVCTKTLRRWHKKGLLIPVCRTHGRHRRYSITQLDLFLTSKGEKSRVRKKKIYKSSINQFRTAAIYGRVSAIKQKNDLERQLTYLTKKSILEGFNKRIIYKDIASGLNDKRAGLKRLIKDAFERKFSTIFITHKDRLARFGTSLLYQVLKLLNIEILEKNENVSSGRILNKDPTKELVNDVLAILTSYSGKLYRMRRGAFT